MEKGHHPPDKGDQMNSAVNLANSEDQEEVGVWSRLFKKASHKTKSKESTKLQLQLQNNQQQQIITLKGDEGIDSSNVSTNFTTDEENSGPDANSVSRFPQSSTGTAIVQLADGTLVALPYTGIPRSNEAMARAVEHALVRTGDSSGSSIELPAGSNNVIFGQSTTMHQGDVDLDSMIEESGGGGRDRGATMSFGNGKQQFAVANQDVSTSSAGNAIASELTLQNGGDRMMSTSSDPQQLDMGGGAAPIKLLHVIPHLDNSAKTGKPIHEKSKSGTSSKNNHVKFDKNTKQTKVLKNGAPRRNPNGTSTKSNRSNHHHGNDKASFSRNLTKSADLSHFTLSNPIYQTQSDDDAIISSEEMYTAIGACKSEPGHRHRNNQIQEFTSHQTHRDPNRTSRKEKPKLSQQLSAPVGNHNSANPRRTRSEYYVSKTDKFQHTSQMVKTKSSMSHMKNKVHKTQSNYDTLHRSKTQNTETETIYAAASSLWSVPARKTLKNTSTSTPCYYDIYEDPNKLKKRVEELEVDKKSEKKKRSERDSDQVKVSSSSSKSIKKVSSKKANLSSGESGTGSMEPAKLTTSEDSSEEEKNHHTTHQNNTKTNRSGNKPSSKSSLEARNTNYDRKSLDKTYEKIYDKSTSKSNREAASHDYTNSLSKEVRKLLQEKDDEIRSGKLRHNQKITEAKAKIHYLAEKVREQIQELKDKDKRSKDKSRKVDDLRRREDSLRKQLKELEGLKAKIKKVEAEKAKLEKFNTEKLEVARKQIQELVIQIKGMENSASNLEQENIELKEKEHRLTRKILELRGTGVDSSDIISLKSSVSRGASSRRSRRSVTPQNEIMHEMHVQQDMINAQMEAMTGAPQVLTTADVTIVHNMSTGDDGPDDYGNGEKITKSTKISHKNPTNFAKISHDEFMSRTSSEVTSVNGEMKLESCQTIQKETSQASSESDIGALVKQASMEQPNCASDMISTYHNIRPSPPKQRLTSQEQSILQRYMDNLQEVSNEEENDTYDENEDVRSRHSDVRSRVSEAKSRVSEVRSRVSEVASRVSEGRSRRSETPRSRLERSVTPRNSIKSRHSEPRQTHDRISLNSRQSSHHEIVFEEAVEEFEEIRPIMEAGQQSQHSELNSSDGEETIAGDHVEFQQQQAINMAIIEAALNAESSDCIDASEYQSETASTTSEARFVGIQAQIAQNLQHYNSTKSQDGKSINLRAGISSETAPTLTTLPQASTFDFCV